MTLKHNWLCVEAPTKDTTMAWTQDNVRQTVSRILGEEFKYNASYWKDQITINVEDKVITFVNLEALSAAFGTKNISYSHQSESMGSEQTGPYGGYCMITINGVK